jgi:hypothetical protein
MTYTYGYDLVNSNLDLVRFEIGDTEGEEAHFLENEEIESLLIKHEDNYQPAVLASIRAIIAKLSRPTFQADWLRVDNKTAIDSYRKLLAEKAAEYGILLGEEYGAWFDSGSVDVTRSDV